MATTQTTAPKAPPAPPSAVGAASAHAPVPAPSPLRPLSISQRKQGEFFQRHWVVELSSGQNFDDCLREDFWSNVSGDMSKWDIISVRDVVHDRFFAEFLIRAVVPPDPRTGRRGQIRLQLLRQVELQPVEMGKIAPNGHEVRWQGRDDGWVILSLATGLPVAKNFGTREEALSRLTDLG